MIPIFRSLHAAFLRSFLCCLIPLFFTLDAQAQQTSALSPGDVVIVTVNSDGKDNFDFVPLVDLSAGTQITFTDDGWDPATASFRNTEGFISFTAPRSIPAGTVISYSGSDGNGFSSTSGTFKASVTGDNILAFQGTKNNPNFLYGVGFAKAESVWTYSNDPHSSGIPAELSAADHTILFLGSDDNLQYNTENGRQGTPKTLLVLVGDETNWKSNNAGGFSALSGKFNLLMPPTITFENHTQSVTEGTTATITAKLQEANNVSLSVDVKFADGPSTADASDFDGPTTQTLTFQNASTGDTQSIKIPLNDEDGFEGKEKAIFQLLHATSGTIIKPAVETVTIKDSQQPAVVINEILYDPQGDANHDGSVGSTSDEFVEMVNTSDYDLDISGWSLSDESKVRYQFKNGTVIPTGTAFVVFSGAAHGNSYGGSYLFDAGSLSLNNDGDEVILKDADGRVVCRHRFAGSSTESITRSPDITGSFMPHSTADTGDHSSYSPGTKIDGTAFGAPATYAISFRGKEGYRFVTTPTQNTTFDDLFHALWTQAIAGSDAPNIDPSLSNLYSWNETGAGGFQRIGDMKTQMQPGKGYIMYVYADNEFKTPGLQGGFPKVIRSQKAPNESVTLNVNANDGPDSDNRISEDTNEGYNLLGNPYGTDISVTAVFDALANSSGISRSDLNGNVYIWNANGNGGNGTYEELQDGSDATIAPFQSFFVRYLHSVQYKVNFQRSRLAANKGALYFKRAGVPSPQKLELRLGNGLKYDSYMLRFQSDGKIGEDRYDGYKLFSLNAHPISLYSRIGDGIQLSKNSLPPVESIKNKIQIPLQYDVPVAGKYHFSWKSIDNIPTEMGLYLIDNDTGERINMRQTKQFSFEISMKQSAAVAKNNKRPAPVLAQSNNVSANTTRFEIAMIPSLAANKDKPQKTQTEPVTVSPSYPNPFTLRTGTSMDVKLKKKMHVTMTIYNIVGQKVAKICDEMLDSDSSHKMTWNVRTGTPSGIYLCKIKAGDHVLTRKMTLVK